MNKSTQVTAAEPGIGLAVVLGLMAGICSLLSAGAAVVLPKLATDINISTTLSVWVISGFSLAYGVTMAAYGRIADLVGLRLPLTVGTIIMSVGALIAALASNFGILMVGRVLQGLGGAAVPVLGVAVVTSFNDHKLKTKGLALVTGLSSAGAGIGPLVGGLLEYVGTWRLSIGITACNAILLMLIWKQVPHKKSAAKFDLVGALLFTGVAAGLVAIIQSVSTGMTVRIIGAALLIVTLPALLIWVKGHPTGFLPISVYKNKEAMRATFATISIPAAWFSTLVAVPIYLHSQGLEPIEIGIAVAPSGLIGFLSAKYSARAIAKFGANRTLIFAAYCSISALLIAFYGSHFVQPYVMAVSIYLVTLGFGMAQPAMVNRINRVVTEDVRGIALGISIMTIFVTGSIAAAMIGGFSDVLGLDYTLLSLLVVPIFVLCLIWPTKNRPRW